MSVKETFKLGFENLKKSYKVNKPKVLSGLGMGGVILTAAVTYIEGPKIKKALDEAISEYQKAETGKDKAAVVLENTVKVGKHAAPVAATVIFTEGCIFGAQKENDKRLGMALAGFAFSQSELIDKNKTIREIVGKKKSEEIEEKTAEKQYAKRLADMPEDPSDCPDFFYDPLSGATWHDSYINTLNGITEAYSVLKAGESITHTDLIDSINNNKNGEAIRERQMSDYFVFDALEAQQMHGVQDFIRLVQMGPNAYKLVYECEVLANPDKFGYPIMMPRDIDSFAGDGVWWH